MDTVKSNLYDDSGTRGMYTAEAAKEAGVSSATISNWLKVGYLKTDNNGLIDRNYFIKAINDNTSSGKLNARANKSKKDSHDHEQVSTHILSKVSDDKLFYDSIGSEYEDNLSDSYRNKEGIYYTPQFIVEDMLPLSGENFENKKFCDPSCGSGNFIIRALELGFKPENIYGFDTDPIAVAITKKRIFHRTGYISNSIIHADFLMYVENKSIEFDYIYTNPPWGKKLEKEEKKQYSNIFGAGKSIDTSALFFFASLYCLSNNGSLGFLVPGAFFNIATFEEVRKEAVKLSIERLIDYGRPFKGLVTEAQAIILSNRPANNHEVQCKIKNEEFTRSVDSFAKTPRQILNFNCNHEASIIIEHVYGMPHITLQDNAEWGMGIVTGNNKKFQNSAMSPGLMPVFKGSDITYNGLKTPSLFIPQDLALYQQVASSKIYEAPEKLIYRFIASKLCFFYDKEQRYVLNSANMIVLSGKLDNMYQQVADLFNSRFMSWMFMNIFNTHKILRGDLESLPIHLEFLKRNKVFNEDKYLKFLKIKKNKNGTYRLKE